MVVKNSNYLTAGIFCFLVGAVYKKQRGILRPDGPHSALTSWAKSQTPPPASALRPAKICEVRFDT